MGAFVDHSTLLCVSGHRVGVCESSQTSAIDLSWSLSTEIDQSQPLSVELKRSRHIPRKRRGLADLIN